MAELHCPNCGTGGTPDSKGRVICSQCGGRFRFVAGEAKLDGVGEFDKLQKRVDDLEARLAERKPPKPDETPDPADPDDDDDLDDDDDDDEDL